MDMDHLAFNWFLFLSQHQPLCRPLSPLWNILLLNSDS